MVTYYKGSMGVALIRALQNLANDNDAELFCYEFYQDGAWLFAGLMTEKDARGIELSGDNVKYKRSVYSNLEDIPV